MISSFNRLAVPADFTPVGVVDHHGLVTDLVLQGQARERAWEYSLALYALEYWGAHRPVDPVLSSEGWALLQQPPLIADIGGAGSNFWRTLTHYTNKPVTRIDPNHEWNEDRDAACYFRETLHQYIATCVADGHATPPQFDAVFAISVIEHVPSKDLQQFEHDLVSLVAPGGLLVLTTDVGPTHPDTYHFHWMRQRIYIPAGLAALHVVAVGSYGLRPLTPPDYHWEGPTIAAPGPEGYTFGALAFVKDA